eukprot:441299-Rhodomonas_salina.1
MRSATGCNASIPPHSLPSPAPIWHYCAKDLASLGRSARASTPCSRSVNYAPMRITLRSLVLTRGYRALRSAYAYLSTYASMRHSILLLAPDRWAWRCRTASTSSGGHSLKGQYSLLRAYAYLPRCASTDVPYCLLCAYAYLQCAYAYLPSCASTKWRYCATRNQDKVNVFRPGAK